MSNSEKTPDIKEKEDSDSDSDIEEKEEKEKELEGGRRHRHRKTKGRRGGRRTRKTSRRRSKALNPWQTHVKKTMSQHPGWMLKQVLKESAKTYKKHRK